MCFARNSDTVGQGENPVTTITTKDDDQIVPIGAAAMQSSKIVKGATLKVIPGAPHGLCSTLKDRVNAELLAFIQHSQHVTA